MDLTKIFPVLHVKGTNYEMGYSIGKTFKSRINHALNTCDQLHLNAEKDKRNPKFLDSLLQHANKHLPQYIDEIQGMADGASCDFRLLLIHNLRHSFQSANNCSTVIFKHTDHMVFGHNEDNLKSLGMNSYIIMAHLENGGHYLAFTNAGSLNGNAWGFNSHGIAMSGNAMPNFSPNDTFPRILIDRNLMEATSINDVIHRISTIPKRAGVYSYNIASLHEHRVINIETIADDIAITEISDRYFHTNHYISPKFKHLSQNVSGSSLTRYTAGHEEIQKVHGTAEDVKNILFHENIHVEEKSNVSGDTGLTLCTPVFELSSNQINLNLFSNKDRNLPIFQMSLDELKHGEN
ncbi:hypothetical protein NEF87_003711 [Candidatus Lokiarchaeum ossiferum]|uniref:Peptidase C45 hydrolase domain-containing protein n=1 Tax=Candidatus Lokiarchaeum ossiferum TaxID=2951803 RepID=A0ABY6HV85_9ARCH|nr:hypothetical protein NEF87_003711 [Candidatus Lokiarchaeum sp. B-35]